MACERTPSPSDFDRVVELTIAQKPFIQDRSRQVDSLLLCEQRVVRDSAAWYRLQLFRGFTHYYASDHKLDRPTLQQVEAWAIRQQPQDSTTLGLICNHYGIDYMFHGLTDSARICYARAVDYLSAPQSPADDYLAAIINLADAHFRLGELASSSHYYRRALYLSDSLYVGTYRAAIYGGLAQIYLDLRNFPETHRYLNLLHSELPHLGSQDHFFYYMTLGNLLYEEERYAAAYVAFRRSMPYARSMGRFTSLMAVTNIAEVSLLDGHEVRAEQYLHQADSLMALCNPCDVQARFYVSSLWLDLAIARGQSDEAARRYRQIQLADSLLLPRYKMMHYRRLARYAESRSDWHQAYILNNQSEIYRDSIRNAAALNSVMEMEQRYSRDTTLLRQAHRISTYESSRTRSRFLFLVTILAGSLLLLIALTLWIMQRRKHERQLNLRSRQILQLRMDVLRNRLSPHYVFNVLGTLHAQMRSIGGLDVLSAKMIDVLRCGLVGAESMENTLTQELEMAHHFADLHAYTHPGEVQVLWRVDPSIEADTWHVPTTCIQMSVENALKHAFPTPSAADRIYVTVSAADDVLHVYITDNGVGFSAASASPSGRDSGTGLRFMSRFLQIYNREVPSSEIVQFSISILSADSPSVVLPNLIHGTEIHFAIPRGFDIRRIES